MSEEQKEPSLTRGCKTTTQIAERIKEQAEEAQKHLDLLRDSLQSFANTVGLLKNLDGEKIRVVDMGASDLLKLAHLIQVVRK